MKSMVENKISSRKSRFPPDIKNDPGALKRYLEHHPPWTKRIVRSNFVHVIAKSSGPAINVNPLITTTNARCTSPPIPSTYARVIPKSCSVFEVTRI